MKFDSKEAKKIDIMVKKILKNNGITNFPIPELTAYLQ